MVIRKIGVLSCGKVSGALYALLGVLIGSCVALFSLIGAGAMMAARDAAPLARRNTTRRHACCNTFAWSR